MVEQKSEALLVAFRARENTTKQMIVHRNERIEKTFCFALKLLHHIAVAKSNKIIEQLMHRNLLCGGRIITRTYIYTKVGAADSRECFQLQRIRCGKQ